MPDPTPEPERRCGRQSEARRGKVSALRRRSAAGGGTIVDEEQRLLRAVPADPDGVLPRPVLAGWLDDHGRAERAARLRLPEPPR